MNNKPKPDNRKDNVERIQENIDNTIKNYRHSEQVIASSDNRQTKEDLKAKNERRLDALDGMKHEIKDEADHAEKEGWK